MNRKIIHAADIHLDSPLQKLSQYEGAPAEQIRRASRGAFTNLIDFAIRESVDLVVIAGDLYDGDWPDQNTGLFFVKEATRLIRAGIPLVVIRGNHDAANLITRTLPLPKNPDGSEVMLSEKKVDCRIFESIGVAVHGKSFLNRVEKDNLALQYPPALGGFFNLGLLHTSLGGFEGHDPYAPCTPGELADKHYDYWALGHIHQRGRHEIEGSAPVVYSGNLQGRHVRECGAKGCYLLTFDDKGHLDLTFHALDVVRWEKFSIEGTSLTHQDELLDRYQDWIADELAKVDGRLLVTRVEVEGKTSLDTVLRREQSALLDSLRSISVSHGAGQVWMENLKVRTSQEVERSVLADEDGPMLSLQEVVGSLSESGALANLIEDEVKNLKKKLPHEIFESSSERSLSDQQLLSELLHSAFAEIKAHMNQAD